MCSEARIVLKLTIAGNLIEIFAPILKIIIGNSYNMLWNGDICTS